MENEILKSCLKLLQDETIKNECKVTLKPLFELILYEINPWIYLIISLIFLIFFMLLIILVILLFILRNKKILNNYTN